MTSTLLYALFVDVFIFFALNRESLEAHLWLFKEIFRMISFKDLFFLWHPLKAHKLCCSASQRGCLFCQRGAAACVLLHENVVCWIRRSRKKKKTCFGRETFDLKRFSETFLSPVKVTVCINLHIYAECTTWWKMASNCVWFAWTIAMSEHCSCTAEWHFYFKQQEGVVCMYVHSQWWSTVGMMKENIIVL